MRYAVLVGIILIAVPLLVRMNAAEPFADAASYEGLRQAQLDSYDSLYSRPYHSTLSDWLFSHIPPQVVLIILAATTLVCLSLLLSQESFLLLAATSPAFIATFTTVGPGALAAAVCAGAALLLSKRQYWAVLAIPICFSLSFSLGIIAGIILITVALLYSLPFVALGASFFSLVSGVVAVVLFPERPLGLTVPEAGKVLGIVGSADGITIFLAFLGIIGLLVSLRESRTHAVLLSLAIVPCVLFFDHGILAIAIYLAYFGSRAWDTLAHRNWNFEELQGITLLLVACGILFTTIVVEKQRYIVDQDRADTVRFVTSAYPKGTTIFAAPDIAPELAYHGYQSFQVKIPPNPGFIASALRDAGIDLVVTRTDYPPVSHFPVLYHERADGYTVYGVPAE